MNSSKKNKKSKGKPPSKERYDQKNPTISFRLDKETKQSLKEHLNGTGSSFADFIKGALGKEKAMVENRIEKRAAQRLSLLEDRVACLESLVSELYLLTATTEQYPPTCPRCNKGMRMSEGMEKGPKSPSGGILTWKCPQCGYFLETYKRVDPKSIKWVDHNSGGYTDKPKPSTRH